MQFNSSKPQKHIVQIRSPSHHTYIIKDALFHTKTTYFQSASQFTLIMGLLSLREGVHLSPCFFFFLNDFSMRERRNSGSSFPYFRCKCGNVLNVCSNCGKNWRNTWNGVHDLNEAKLKETEHCLTSWFYLNKTCVKLHNEQINYEKHMIHSM